MMKQGIYIDIYVVMAAMSHCKKTSSSADVHQELRDTVAAYRKTIAYCHSSIPAQAAAPANKGLQQSGAAAAMLSGQQAA